MKKLAIVLATIICICNLNISAKQQVKSFQDKILLGQKYLFEDKYDSAFVLLSESEKEWLHIKDNRNDSINNAMLLPILFNGLGVYKILYEKDYKSAIEYFILAINHASSNNLDIYSEIVCNLTYLLFIRGDSTGLQYSLDLFHKGKKTHNERQAFLGANCAALMYYTKGDLDNAEAFLNYALNSTYIDSINTPAYNLMAMIYDKKGNKPYANLYYKKAMDNIDPNSASSAIHLCLSYGYYLISCNNPKKAETILIRGLNLSHSKKNYVFEHDLYLALSDAYIAQGKLDKGLEAYKKYHSLEKDFFNLEHDREVVKMMVQFDTEKHKAELQRKNLDLAHRRNQLRVLSIAICVILTMLIIIAVMYRHKSKMYLSIAKKYKEEAERKAQATIHPGKSEELFERLEALMNEKKVYRNSMISRDDIADMLGTNRTYLTSVISDRTKKNFNQYINSFRMAEALSILSDAEKEVVLKDLAPKVGFNSISTFYKLFKEEIGMTPAKFREQILYLGKKKEK